MSFDNPTNLLLRHLSQPVAAAIFEAAEYVHLDIRENLIEPNKQIMFVDFPESGVMSLLTPMDDGSLVEIATIGNEGMVGVSLALGVSTIPEIAFCQVAGASWRIPADVFRKLLDEHEELRSLCQRYAMALFDQVARNTGCNRTHSIEERCARWLLMTQDRCGQEEFVLTQEFLAMMLGVSRTGVNLAAGILAKAGLLTYVRGKIKILDRQGMEDACCQCYFEMRDYAAKIIDK